jgi:2-polyprenyl-6-methoxyphenol hydroxylase-like FAD-dependent oxidoreductase
MSEQVLIVGAGPVGLTMAAELRRYGVPVRIIEKSGQRTEQSRALFLWTGWGRGRRSSPPGGKWRR